MKCLHKIRVHIHVTYMHQIRVYIHVECVYRMKGCMMCGTDLYMYVKWDCDEGKYTYKIKYIKSVHTKKIIYSIKGCIWGGYGE